MRQNLCRVVAFGGDHLAGGISHKLLFLPEAVPPAVADLLPRIAGGLQSATVGQRRKLKPFSHGLLFRPLLRFLMFTSGRTAFSTVAKAITLPACTAFMNFFPSRKRTN